MSKHSDPPTNVDEHVEQPKLVEEADPVKEQVEEPADNPHTHHKEVSPEGLDTEFKLTDQGAAAPDTEVRRSARERRMTTKMLEYTEEQAAQKEKKSGGEGRQKTEEEIESN